MILSRPITVSTGSARKFWLGGGTNWYRTLVRHLPAALTGKRAGSVAAGEGAGNGRLPGRNQPFADHAVSTPMQCRVPRNLREAMSSTPRAGKSRLPGETADEAVGLVCRSMERDAVDGEKGAGRRRQCACRRPRMRDPDPGSPTVRPPLRSGRHNSQSVGETARTPKGRRRAGRANRRSVRSDQHEWRVCRQAFDSQSPGQLFVQLTISLMAALVGGQHMNFIIPNHDGS